MTLVLTEHNIQLTCLSEPHMIETLDFDQLVEDLADGTPPVFLTPERICVQDLIVVAALVKPGAKSRAKPTRYLGLLGARDDTAGGQAFLRLDMACVAPRSAVSGWFPGCWPARRPSGSAAPPSWRPARQHRHGSARCGTSPPISQAPRSIRPPPAR